MSDPLSFDVLRKQVDRADTRVVDTEDTPVASAPPGATTGSDDPPPVQKKALKPTQFDSKAGIGQKARSPRLAMTLWIVFWITLTLLVLNHLTN